VILNNVSDYPVLIEVATSTFCKMYKNKVSSTESKKEEEKEEEVCEIIVHHSYQCQMAP